MKGDDKDFAWQTIAENVKGFFGIFGEEPDEILDLIKKELP